VKEVVASGSLEAASLSTDGILASSKVQTGTVEASGDITTPTSVLAKDLKATETVESNSLNVKTEITSTTLKTTSDITTATSIKAKDAIVEASLSSDIIKVANTIDAIGDITTEATMTAKEFVSKGSITASSSITAVDLTGSGTLTGEHLVALGWADVGGDLKVAGSIEVKNAGVTADTFTAAKSIAAQVGEFDSLTLKTALNVGEGNVVAKDVEASSGAIGSLGVSSLRVELKEGVEGSGSIESDAVTVAGVVKSGDIEVSEGITTKDLTVSGEASASSLTLSGKLIASKDVQVDGALTSASITVGAITSSSDQITSESATTKSFKADTIEAAGEVTLGGAVTAVSSIGCNSLSIETDLTSKHISTGTFAVENDAEVTGRLSVKGDADFDFMTVTQIEASSAKLDGSLVAEKSVEAVTGIFSESVKAPKVEVEGEVIAESVVVTGTVSSSALTSSGSLEVTGDSKLAGLEAFDASFSGTVKSTSLQTSRLYSEDMTASGFVVGNIVKSKGDVEAAAAVNAATVVATGTITGADVVATNKVSGAIAEIGGLVMAGSLEAKIVSVADTLTVGNVDVGPSVLAMSAKIEELYELVQGLSAKIAELEKGLADGVVEAGGMSVTEDEGE